MAQTCGEAATRISVNDPLIVIQLLIAGLGIVAGGREPRMRARWLISLAITIGWLAPLTAPAVADPSGIVIAVVQATEADGQTGKRLVTQNGPVYSGDHITTGPGGQAQIRFRDNTKLVVGPDSMMVIDAFIFEGDTARKISINAVRGAFRFIAGKSPKDAYSITTPTATIGVRG